MIRTLDFNAFAAGTVIDDEYADMGVTVSAIGGSGQAMIFDSANPTGEDEDLGSDTLQGILIVSEDGDSSDPDDNAEGGSIFFNFECPSRIKFLTFKDIEEGGDARMIFYDDQGRIIDNQWVGGTGNGGELTVQLAVQNVSRMEVLFNESGAIDNLIFDDGKPGKDNQAPDAVDDTLEMFEDGTAIIFPLVNDSDPDGDPLTILSATSPNGTVTTDGTSVTFTPAPDYNGPAVVNYVITDGRGGADDANINITVLPVNDAPVAVDDADSTTIGTPVVVDLRSNDTDVDDPTSSLTISDVTSPNGTISNVAGGFATFTPAAGFTGEAIINYRVTDPGGLSDTGVARVTVTDDGSANRPPAAVDDVAVTDEDTPIVLTPLANDTDPDGDPLTIISATSPDGSVTTDGTTITFTPAPDYNGPATVSYVVADPSGATDGADISVTVRPVNDAPIAIDDTASTDVNTPVVVDLRGNDQDVDDPLTSLTISGVSSPNGTVVNNGDGTVTFTPSDDFTGETVINYTVTDPGGLSDTGLARVVVGDVDNSAPVAVDDTVTMDEDTTVVISPLANDSDPDGDPLTIVDASSPDGTVTFTDTTVTFTPAPDYTGPATISYTITDTTGRTDSADINVTVNPINDAPVAVDDTDTTAPGTPVVVDLRSNDTDVDDPTDSLIISGATSPNGTVVNNGDGTVTFTPAAGFTGDAVINYTVSDPDGLSDDGVATVSVTDDPNGPPVAVDDTVTMDEDTTVVLTPLTNDSDPDGDPLTIIGASSPDGTVTFTDTTVTFTPAPDYNGPATVTYMVSDGEGGMDSADINITVEPVNDAPVAVDDTASTLEGTPVIVDLRGNDTDPDDPVQDLTITAVSSPNGTVVNNGDGTVTFTPADDFVGTATIDYTVSDPDGLTDTGEAAVLVTEDDGGDPDGYVDGDDTGNLIDEAYDGDPNGDFIDNDDAILPGTEGDDDYVRAGGGDDTVIADDGNDTVEGGAGDDDIDTGNGDVAPDLGYPFAATDALGYAPDSDPENDRDFVDGGTGDDTISTGDDRDTIIGGDGADVIDGGIDDDSIRGDDDDDRIVGGEGNDSILGGEGNDTIYAGNDPDLGLDILDITDEPTAGSPFSPDRQPLNGRDTVDGGAGDDVIFGADDDDVLLGGSGNDFIDGQIDDDTIDGNTGDDTLLGGQGDDSVEGGQGDDQLSGGDGDDTLRGNRDDDLLEGGAGNDSLDGGGENDTVDGGDGDDSLTGNQGDDLLLGGAGADTMSGGAGRDTFNDVTAGDVIDGGSGPVDFDTLFLAGSAPEGGRFEITYTSADREDGFVDYFNADDSDAGRLTFVEIENVVPCFTPGTKIATPRGEVLVEDLKVGDRVITRDNGMQEIRWVGAREMTGAEFEAAPHLKPILIRAGALDNGLPERDMMVSPQHRVLIANDKTALYFEEREVLVAAKHLTDREGIDQVDVSGTTYIHIMFDQHEVILSDGSWTESFQPGDMSLAGIGEEQRQEILELFPELATEEGIESYSAARRSLKGFEAKLLSD